MTVKLQSLASLLMASMLIASVSGCACFPDVRQRDRIHNPFPQLKKVAILPFFNQSSEPTVDTDLVTQQYFVALQAIPGFEVTPIGVVKAKWLQYSLANGEPRTGEDFQKLAKQLGVEALVVGSVTDFDAYYPPRMAMTVDWYAANEGFHQIPPGYGLPWGTKHEKDIPKRIAREAEFELARSQLATQSPVSPESVVPPFEILQSPVTPVSGQTALIPPTLPPSGSDPIVETLDHCVVIDGQFDGEPLVIEELDAPLPMDWPNPTDLIPDPPSPVAPIAIINHDPVLSHTRLYRGDDPYFTNRLADHVETGDDARPSGWQGYLKRSDDFILFCCHLHITEMLESRGGSDQRDLILRWPVSRY